MPYPFRLAALAATLAAACVAGSALAGAAGPSGLRITNKLTIGGDAGWDYVNVDVPNRRVYITHFRSVEVLDADTFKPVGRIADMNGARGVAIVNRIGKGFATNGKSNSVTVFDLKTLAKEGEIAVGKKPDATIYDAGTDRVLVNNGDGDSMSVIDPATRKVVGTIELQGGPEFLAADGKGTVWTNIFDEGGYATVDLKSMKLVKKTPVAGCKGAGSMAFDAVHRRLFIGCHSGLLAVVDPDTGRLVQSLKVGEHPDANIYDPAGKMLYASSGDGLLTVVRQDDADHYTTVEQVKTLRGAKTMGFDPKTGKLFSATVENVPENATSQPAPLGKVAYTPGPFVAIEIGR